MPPAISVILPTHNGAHFIRRAIESVRSQTVKDWELIIINDGSTDQTGALVAEISAVDSRIRVFRFETNKGIQKALNEGILQAKASLIARIDDDDVWCDPKKLEKQLSYLGAHSDCVLIGTGIIVQDEHGDELYRFLNPADDSLIRRKILYRNCFSHSSVVFRKKAALQFNGYDESEVSRHAEDYDLWLKLGTLGTLANLPEYCVRFTSRPGTISAHNKLSQFRRQLKIISSYRTGSAYPNYGASRAKSIIRLLLYWTFGNLIPKGLQARFIEYYKKI